MGGLGGAGPSDITVVTFDHPFLFLIRDVTSGAIIFTAQVADPTVSG
jgi:serpin B